MFGEILSTKTSKTELLFKNRNIMEDIKKKAKDDELNKSRPEIGKAPRKFKPVPKMRKCTECGRVFDSNEEGQITSSDNLCGQCLR